ncbi:uncharacterized protein DFO68_104126 [Halomonas ventosae]|uniref:Large ribosomal RNA subunit accumulation protein YceD n=1 Tax=Halomonas ventosae TaxID=229007 RepID=A0A4R6HTT2_9GAMM|nr:uncharacterized protein DFO68_104126 [Halomonas ventosae]
MARAEHLEGLVALADMARLAEQAGAQSGDARVWLDFGIDAQGCREICGHLEAELQLSCRRCLEPVAQRIDSDFRLGMVTSDALAAELPGTHEPVLVENEQLNLLAVLEDELILSLPQVVYHDEAECPVSRDQLHSGEASDASIDSPVSPFDVLRQIKGKL